MNQKTNEIVKNLKELDNVSKRLESDMSQKNKILKGGLDIHSKYYANIVKFVQQH
jgi:hypothetical protein